VEVSISSPSKLKDTNVKPCSRVWRGKSKKQREDDEKAMEEEEERRI
jgi:hypothetical protein